MIDSGIELDRAHQLARTLLMQRGSDMSGAGRGLVD
jgi:hypothetical protein